MRHLLEDGDCGSRSSSQVCSDSPLSRIQWDESVSSCAKPLVQGRVELDLELVNTEAILRVIGYLHSEKIIISVVANICLRSETRENCVMGQGNM